MTRYPEPELETRQHVRYEALAHFTEWLQWIVKTRHLSRRDVARVSGVDQSTVTRLLNGRREPTLETALKIVNGLT